MLGKPTLRALYISNQTRPDITFAVSRCQREVHKPTYSLILAIKRIMQYLKGTQTLGLEFKRDKTIKNIENEQQLKAYFDASWGGWESHLETTMKSTSGYIITFMNTPISWGSTLQKDKPAQSSGESEYIAAYHGAT